MKQLLRILFYAVLLVALLISAFLVVLTIMDYRPPAKEPIYRSVTDEQELDTVWTFRILTWNIGYGGLGKDMDFFYDGGSRVRTEQSTFHDNIDHILQFIEDDHDIDFCFIQEVDVLSRRSYYVNQFEMMQLRLDYAHFVFAKNYDVTFVPVPLFKPMGKVLGGLMTLSKSKPSESVRHSLPGNYPWPKRLFLLDRCFLLNRYPVAGGSELVLINTHNSAFDDGFLRREQLAILVNVMVDEYEKGNYVVVGGDWNLNPTGFDPGMIISGDATMVIEPVLNEGSFPAGWAVVYDPQMPTNRDLSMPYLRGSTPTTIIDFFVCSPNIGVLDITAINLIFGHADHNPVIMEFALRSTVNGERE